MAQLNKEELITDPEWIKAIKQKDCFCRVWSCMCVYRGCIDTVLYRWNILLYSCIWVTEIISNLLGLKYMWLRREKPALLYNFENMIIIKLLENEKSIICKEYSDLT